MILNQYKKPKDKSQVNLQTQLVDLKHAVKELQDEQGYQWVDLHDLMNMLSVLHTGIGQDVTASGCLLRVRNILSPTSTSTGDFTLYVPGDTKIKIYGVEYETKEFKDGYQDGDPIEIFNLDINAGVNGHLIADTQYEVASFRATSPWVDKFPVDQAELSRGGYLTQEELDSLKIEGTITRQFNNEDDRPKIDYSVLDRVWGKKINMEDNDFRYVQSYFQNFLGECANYKYSEEPTTWQYGIETYFTVNGENSVTINNHTYTPEIFGPTGLSSDVISLTVLMRQINFLNYYIDSEISLLRMDPYSVIVRNLYNYFKHGVVQFKLPNDFVNLIYKRL